MRPIMGGIGGGRAAVNRGMETRPRFGGLNPLTPNVPVAQPFSFKKGGKVKKTGLALVHRGEVVKPAKKSGAKRVMSTPKGKASRARVSKKIKVLRAEGTPQKQSIAEALSMERAHRITPSGGYRRVKK